MLIKIYIATIFFISFILINKNYQKVDMEINKVNNISFQRALSTKEKAAYMKLCNAARKELELKQTSAVIFDFNMPSLKDYNYGIGTLNSKAAYPFVKFLKEMAGISNLQIPPQTELLYSSDGKRYFYTTSPYSGSTFTLGTHTIALERLADREYGSLLDKNYVKSLDTNYNKSRTEREYKADYDYVLGNNRDGVLINSLKTAYNKFKNTPDTKLNAEFKEFKSNMSEDTKKNIVYDAIVQDYHKLGKSGTDVENWSYVDKHLFTEKISAKDRAKRIKKLAPEIDFLSFCQFIAQKQHLETKTKLNKNGITTYGDCLICFSPKEVWMNPECFHKHWYTGVEDPNCPETNNIQGWHTPSLNFDRLGEFDENNNIIKLDSTGMLLYNKFKNFLKLYDGIRMDAFWQYVTPFMYNENLEGKYTQNLGNKIIKIMEKASIDTKGYFSPEDYILELVGYGTQQAKDMTKNTFPHVYSTAYAEYNENPGDLMNKVGYKDGAFTIGAANHDNDSLINMSRDINKRNAHREILMRNLGEGYNHTGYQSTNYAKQSPQEKSEQDFRTAKIAEIFTTGKQYFTLPDFFGMSERINNTGKIDKNNWLVRIPSNYEEFYFTQLSKGYGINIPKAYEVALYAKNSNNSELIQKLKDASEILAKEGPMTEAEANIAEKNGTLGEKLCCKI